MADSSYYLVIEAKLAENTKTEIKSAIQEDLNAISEQVSLTIKKINIDLDPAIKDLKTRLQSNVDLKDLKVDVQQLNVSDWNLNTKGIQEKLNKESFKIKLTPNISKTLVVDKAKFSANALNNLKKQFTDVGFTVAPKVKDSKKSNKSSNTDDIDDLSKQEKKVTDLINKTKDALRSLDNLSYKIKNGDLVPLVKQLTDESGLLKNKDLDLLPNIDDIDKQIDSLKVELESLTKIRQELEDGNTTSYDAQFESIKKTTAEADVYAKNLKSVYGTARQLPKELDKINRVQANMTSYLNKYGDRLKAFPQLYQELINLQQKAALGNMPYTQINSAFIDIQNRARAAGVEVESLWTTMKKAFGGRFRGQIALMGWTLLTSSVRQVYDNVVQLDTAMTELRKVTDATEQKYNEFLDGASERARRLGANLTEVVNATADFARLGYSIDEASQLADASLIYLNVGDDVEDIDQASSSLISTMKAFGIEAQNVVSIVDEFNEVANRMPVSAGDIGEGLRRSASSLATANNTLEESIALFTAGNQVVQDSASMGNILKTTTMRIRSAASELEEAGLETEGMAESTAKLRQQIIALTGGFDIMEDAAGTTFKSTYDILKGISEVWDDMQDVSQASLLELLAGKRNGNALAAILENFETAEETLIIAQNAAGSAIKENEVYLQSIQGRLDKLTASWQALSQDLLNSKLVKNTISGLTSIVDLLDKLIDQTGALSIGLGAIGSIALTTNASRNGIFNGQTVNNTYGNIGGNILSGLFSSAEKISTGSVLNTIIDKDDLAVIDQLNAKIIGTGKSAVDALYELDDIDKVSDNVRQLIEEFDYGEGTVKQFGITTKETAQGLRAGVPNVKSFGKAIMSVGATIGSALIEFAAITVATMVITKVVQSLRQAWIDHSKSLEAVKQRTSEMADELTAAKDELTETKDKLTEITQRIQELNNATPLSLTDQDELKRLESERDTLLTILKTKQAIANNTTDKVTKSNLKDMNMLLQQMKDANQIIVDSKNKKSSRTVTRENAKGKVTSEYTIVDNTGGQQASKARKELEATKEVYEELIGSIDLDDLNTEQLEQYNGYMREYVTILRSLGDIDIDTFFDLYFTDEEYNQLNQKFKELAQSGNYTADTIFDAFDSETVTAFEAAGISSEDLAEHIRAIDIELKKAKAEGRNLEEVFDYSEAISNLNELKTGFDAIQDAYDEFNDNGVVASDTLSDLYSTFGDKSYVDSFVQVLGDANSTMADVQQAANDFATAFINDKISTEELTDATKDLYISQLDEMGVANATEVVETKLAIAKLKNVNSTEEEIQVASDLIIKLIQSGDAFNDEAFAAVSAADKINIFKAAQELAVDNNFAEVVQSHAQAILNVGTAAGASIPNLKKYATLLGDLKVIESMTPEQIKAAGGQLASIKREMASIEASAKTELQGLFDAATKVTFTSTGDSSSSVTDTRYADAKSKLDHKLTMNKISYEKYYKELEALGKKYLKKNTDDWRSYEEDLSSTREDAFDDYQADLDDKLDNNKISLEDYYNQSTALQDKWLKKNKSNADALADAQEALQEKIIDNWDKAISNLQTTIDRAELMNPFTNDEQLEMWNRELKELKSQFEQGIITDSDSYWEQYYSILEKINDLEEDIANNRIDRLKDEQDALDDLIDMVSDMLKQELEDEIDHLNDIKDRYQEIVDAKKDSLSITKEENEYQKDLAEKTKTLSDLQAQAAVLALDNSREGQAKYKQVLDKIAEAQEDLNDLQSDKAYDASISALETAESEYEEHISDQIDSINDKMDKQGEWMKYVYKYIDTTQPSTLLQKLYSYNETYGTGLKSTVDDIWDTAGTLLTSTEYGTGIERLIVGISNTIKSLESTSGNNIDTGAQGGAVNNGGYRQRISDELRKAVNVSTTQGNSDTVNRGLVNRLQEEAGLQAWYDSQNKAIYIGNNGDKRYTAGAYDLLKEMESIAYSDKSNTDKKNLLDVLLTSLKKKWSYSQAYIDYTGTYPHLYKKQGGLQVFHSGIDKGFVGGKNGTSNKQRELLARLQAGELVLNKTQQEKLAVQMQVLGSLADDIRKIQLGSNVNNNLGGIVLNVSTPITIQGDANDETVKKLESLSDKIANTTLEKLNNAMQQRGYNSKYVANNARRL